jgi:hypothetical protein
MANPITFISRNRVKSGMIEQFIKHYGRSIPPIEANKPGTLLQVAYMNEDATEVTIVRIFPDADALNAQLQGADQRSKVAYEFIEPASIEIYGTPSDLTLETMRRIAGSGIDVSVFPQFIGGFIRPGPG